MSNQNINSFDSSQTAQTREEFESQLVTKAWQDEAFKQELISNPNAIYARELGQPVPENLEIRVLEETPTNLYLVLPNKPQVSEELSDEALEAVAGGKWWLITPIAVAGGGA